MVPATVQQSKGKAPTRMGLLVLFWLQQRGEFYGACKCAAGQGQGAYPTGSVGSETADMWIFIIVTSFCLLFC
jgi:hypothetical protein